MESVINSNVPQGFGDIPSSNGKRTWDVLTKSFPCTVRYHQYEKYVGTLELLRPRGVRQNDDQTALRRKVPIDVSSYSLNGVLGTLGLRTVTHCTLRHADLTAQLFASNIWHCCPVAEQVVRLLS